MDDFNIIERVKIRVQHTGSCDVICDTNTRVLITRCQDTLASDIHTLQDLLPVNEYVDIIVKQANVTNPPIMFTSLNLPPSLRKRKYEKTLNFCANSLNNLFTKMFIDREKPI